jgi:riboflavin synthase
MFAGIIKHLGEVESLVQDGTNLIITIKSPLSNQLSIDQSVAHDGICLTVVEVKNDTHTVVAIKESVDKTNLSSWVTGKKVNLELCITATQKIDGHFVQGHVDTKGTISNIESMNGSWEFTITFPKNYANLLVSKGSVTINGISLTVIEPDHTSLRVAIIPYTYENTNLHTLQVGDPVNLEFDIIGKYLQRHIELNLQMD